MNRLVWILTIFLVSSYTYAVRTERLEHRSESAFKAGKTEKVLINSEGELSLAYRMRTLLEKEDAVWVVNAIVRDDQGNLFVATSGEGLVYRVSPDWNSEVIYGGKEDSAQHVFSLALDNQGRLLAGTGGEAAQLLRFDKKNKTTVLHDEEGLKYIWSIVVGPGGRIYLGTGSPGKVVTLDASGKKAETLYEIKEKNILSLALNGDGILYAGGDERGLVYRIDPGSKQATIAYDTGSGEISGLVFDEAGNLYAATTGVSAGRPGAKLILSDGQAGRVDSEEEGAGDSKVERKKREQSEPEGLDDESVEDAEGESPVEVIPPASGEKKASTKGGSIVPKAPGKPSKENNVYKITPGGYVSRVFSQKVMILSLAYVPGGELLIGLAHEGSLLSLDLTTREAVVLVEAEPSLQVSAVFAGPNGTIYVGGANPGQVLAVEGYFAEAGHYESDVIDVTQISSWGKLQIEAQVPPQSSLTVSTRSGNTVDPEEGGWEEWTRGADVGEDSLIQSSPARFLQYRLNFSSESGEKTAVVRSVELAYVTPNLAPKVMSVDVSAGGSSRSKGEGASKDAGGSLTVKWKAEDENSDTLEYSVWLRPVGKSRWIRVAKELEKDSYAWDSKTFPDGRYEFKVVVSDGPGNARGTELSDSRISRAVTVDNTPPEVAELGYKLDGKQVTVIAVVEDSYSVVGSVAYTLDSAEKWQVALPADGVFDSRRETIEFDLEADDAGEHYLVIRFSDALGNDVSRYLMFEVPE